MAPPVIPPDKKFIRSCLTLVVFDWYLQREWRERSGFVWNDWSVQNIVWLWFSFFFLVVFFFVLVDIPSHALFLFSLYFCRCSCILIIVIRSETKQSSIFQVLLCFLVTINIIFRKEKLSFHIGRGGVRERVWVREISPDSAWALPWTPCWQGWLIWMFDRGDVEQRSHLTHREMTQRQHSKSSKSNFSFKNNFINHSGMIIAFTHYLDPPGIKCRPVRCIVSLKESRLEAH